MIIILMFDRFNLIYIPRVKIKNNYENTKEIYS